MKIRQLSLWSTILSSSLTYIYMNKNNILSGGGKNLIGGGKWGRRGREVGEKGEGSGGKGGGNWEWGTSCPPPQ